MSLDPGDEATGEAKETLDELKDQVESLRRELERQRLTDDGRRGLFESILYHVPNGILVCNTAGKITLHNRAAEQIWRGSASIETIEDWAKYRGFHPDGTPFEGRDWTLAQCMREQRAIEPREIPIRRFDDTDAVLLCSGAPLFDDQGELAGAVGVFSDITEFKAVEQSERRARAAAERNAVKREQSYERLSRSLRARQELLSVLAHDLRSPLTVVKLNLALIDAHLEASGAHNEQVADVIEASDQSLRRVVDMMDDLLDSFRSEAEQMSLRVEDIDFARAVRTAVCDVRSELDRTGTDVSLDMEEPLWGGCDRVRLQQIVSNLLSNAIKYGHGEPIELTLSATDDEVTLVVRDHGEGIPKEHQEGIFDRFERAAAARDDSFGLGLWIVKRIVDALGGTIDLDSTPGEGCRFGVTIPRWHGDEELGLASPRASS